MPDIDSSALGVCSALSQLFPQTYETAVRDLTSTASAAFNSSMAKADVVASLLDQTLAKQAANAQALGAVLSILQVRYRAAAPSCFTPDAFWRRMG